MNAKLYWFGFVLPLALAAAALEGRPKQLDLPLDVEPVELVVPPSLGPLERITLYAAPYSTGNLTLYRNFAREEWRPGPENPLRLGVPIVAFWGGEDFRMCRFDGTDFVQRNRLSRPLWWAYVRMPDAPDPPDAPPAVPSEIPPVVQHMVDALLRSFPWQTVMDAADRSPWGVPGEGAPEEE